MVRFCLGCSEPYEDEESDAAATEHYCSRECEADDESECLMCGRFFVGDGEFCSLDCDDDYYRDDDDGED